MVRRLVFATAFVALIAAAVALVAEGPPPAAGANREVQCIEDPLGPAPEWTLAIHGDLVQANTDSEGRIAVGGDATLTNFGVADRLPVDGSRVDLIVGGDLNATSVGVNNGSVVYGDELRGTVSAPNGTISKRPLDVDALFQEGERRAEAWKELEPNGTISGPEFGALYLTGEDPKLNVFRVNAERLESAQRILLRVPFGSSVLVNVLGDSYSTATDPMTVSVELWNGNSYVQFGDSAPSPELEALRRSLLWNFAEASAVQIGPNLAWQGSVLAPRAAFSFPANTQLNGTIVAGSLAGDGESHLHPPDQICLPSPGIEPPAPPEPPPPAPEPPPPPTGPGPEPPPGPPTGPGPQPPEPGLPPGSNQSPPPEPPPFSTPSQEAPQLPGAGSRTNFEVVKQVLDRRGRPVQLLEARPGQLVRFRLYGYNLGFVSARKVVACDMVPPGLKPIHPPGDPTFRHGRLCWRLGTVDTQRQGIVTFRVRSNVCGRVVNVLRVHSDNGGRHGDTAEVSACRRVPPRQTG